MVNVSTLTFQGNLPPAFIASCADNTGFMNMEVYGTSYVHVM